MIVWVAKLSDYIINELLQDCDIDPDSGCFNPFPTYMNYDKSVGDWEIKGFCFPFFNGYRTISLKDKTLKKGFKMEYETQNNNCHSLLKKLID